MGVTMHPSGRSGLRNRRTHRPMSDINVTPFVDVMLVLLIIFMVTAPMMVTGVPVDLPETSAGQMNEKTEPLTISLNVQGKIFIHNTEVSLDTLLPKLKAITEAKSDTRIYIRGDHKLGYGHIMEVMSVLTTAGYNKVALITKAPDVKKPTKNLKKINE